MALQYNFVFDRAGGLAQLNNLSWPQWVNTIIPPKAGELENGTYRPSLAPVNFKQSKLGTKYVTVWYAGPLSINNHRGQLEFIPSNLQQFTGADPKAGSDVPANPSLPDYQRDVQSFPNVPLIQPPLNSVDEWRFINHNNDEHPIHVHVNDFQVIEYFDPTIGLRTGPDKFAIDNANAPAPTMHGDESVIEPGVLTIRTRFDEYTGLYVMHCHRLNHEDNGLMALINVIPAVSVYAVAIPGTPGRPAEVRQGVRLPAAQTHRQG